MGYKFTPADAYEYQPGGLFLGVDDDDREIGIATEKHLITIAAPRTGKGAALIIPNLLRWKDSALVVDPKGENADATAVQRANMGQLVGILDPYHECKNPAVAMFRRSINPIALINPASRSASLLVEKIADGLIRRFDPRHAQWDNAGCTIGGGLMAFIRLTAPPEDQHMGTFRKLLLQTPDELGNMANLMREVKGLGGLTRSAAVSILTGLKDEKSPDAGGLNRLREETKWMDDEPMQEVLSSLPPFDLRSLKQGKSTLYLVIPADSIMERSGFLRLFTRIALSVMTEGLAAHPGETAEKGGRCLFILDEFHTLGTLESVKKGCGLLPGFGVHLWPFLHNIGQLTELYGNDGAGAFFASSDAQIYFGNTDQDTLNTISKNIGVVTQADIGATPPVQSSPNIDPDRKAAAYSPLKTPQPINLPMKGKPGSMGNLAGMGAAATNFARSAAHHAAAVQQAQERLDIEREEREHAIKDENARRAYQEKMARKGEPHLKPSEIRDLVAKRDDLVARSMIVFAKGDDVLNLRLLPYFRANTPSPASESVKSPKAVKKKTVPHRVRMAMDRFMGAAARLEAENTRHEQLKIWASILAIFVFLFLTLVTLLTKTQYFWWFVAAYWAFSIFSWISILDKSRERVRRQAVRSRDTMQEANPILREWEEENGPISEADKG